MSLVWIGTLMTPEQLAKLKEIWASKIFRLNPFMDGAEAAWEMRESEIAELKTHYKAARNLIGKIQEDRRVAVKA